jgi:hypothetical protein
MALGRGIFYRETPFWFEQEKREDQRCRDSAKHARHIAEFVRNQKDCHQEQDRDKCLVFGFVEEGTNAAATTVEDAKPIDENAQRATMRIAPLNTDDQLALT